MQAGGKVILGQDPDSLLGSFDIKQSFVGEISDVDLWDYVLSDSSIKELTQWKRATHLTCGDVLNWDKAKLIYHGTVHTVYHRL